MKLYDILNGLEIIKSTIDFSEEITGICSDARNASTGCVFIAIQGTKRNGNDYINRAFSLGAKCVITDSLDSYNEHVDYAILVKDARIALSFAWNNYFSGPSKDMKLIAITGTNGKTSTSYYIYNALRNSNKKAGLISTVECLINDNIYKTGGGTEVSDLPSAMTTPDPKILYSILYEMKKNGVEYVVMEASSHALAQHKLEPLEFEIGIFTNLSQEHLDFHLDMENYYECKKSLFDRCKRAIINIDDIYGKRLFDELNSPKISCSISTKAGIYAENKQISSVGIEYFLKTKYESFKVKNSVCAEFAISNTLLASACALSLSLPTESIVNAISTTQIRGRLEKISDKNIFIDYAHSPKAFENVLNSIRKTFPKSKIVALFGCGGDRDTSKRSTMGKIASDKADKIIITSDNARTENPVSIICDILAGIDSESDFVVIPKRADAIKYAIKNITQNEVLLLLGKGHESYEIDKTGKHYFSEREIVREVLENGKN